MSNFAVRRLTADDAEAFIVLRREALAGAPWAFAASPEDDVGLDSAFIASRLALPETQAIVGAWDDAGRLRGAAGVIRDRRLKMAHRARIWGVYVSPSARRAGVGTRIIAAAIDAARSWPGVTSIGLSVSEKSREARRLYERAGFRPWGVEPGALVFEGRAFDEVHMCLYIEARLPASQRE